MSDRIRPPFGVLFALDNHLGLGGESFQAEFLKVFDPDDFLAEFNGHAGNAALTVRDDGLVAVLDGMLAEFVATGAGAAVDMLPYQDSQAFVGALSISLLENTCRRGFGGEKKRRKTKKRLDV